MKKTTINNKKNGKVIAVCAALAAAMAMTTATVMVASASSTDIGTTNRTVQIQTAAKDTKAAAPAVEIAKTAADDKVNEMGKHPGESGYCYAQNEVNEMGKHPGESGYCYSQNQANV